MSKHFQPLFDALSQRTQIDTEIHELITKKSVVRKVKRSDYLFQEGQDAANLFYIVQGGLRLFALDDDFKEYTIRFGFENTTVGDFDALLRKTTTQLNLQAVENSIVLQICSKGLQELFNASAQLSGIYKTFLEQELARTQKRIINHLVKDAGDRYMDFLKIYGHQNNRIPDRHIASFIGVTPEFFSKLKKKKMREFLNLP